jgi:hypothetical protein
MVPRELLGLPDVAPTIMNIEIHDTDLEGRIQKQIQATGSGSVEEALMRLLDTREAQDLWLLENRASINANETSEA